MDENNNIIFFANHIFYKNGVGKTSYNFINAISEENMKYNIIILYSDDNIKNIIQTINIIQPKLIIVFDINKFNISEEHAYLFNFKIPVCIFLDDCYYITTLTKPCPLVNKTSSIIYWYKSLSINNSLKNHFPEKIIKHTKSRYVNTNIYQDYKMEKKYDILIYGTRNFFYDFKTQDIESIQKYINEYEQKKNTIVNKINFYQLRERLESLLIKNQHKYNIKILPEKTINDCQVANEDLAKLINESYLVIACPSIADVLLHKFLEISACNSTILGMYPSDYEDLFKGHIVEVNEYMTDEQIISIIDDALNDKIKLKEMTEKLYLKTHNEHNLKVAQEDFNNIMTEIISSLY